MKLLPKTIKIIEENSIGWIILSRPERRNALNREMWQAIPVAVARLEKNQANRVIVIRGEGEEAFASGADISEFSQNRANAKAARAYEMLNGRAFSAIREARKPVIAMIHGICFGGGLALALACDLRMASDKAVFCLPPARLGLAYPLAGLADLLATVSLSTAKEMLFTARRINAGEARQRGLIDEIAATDELEQKIRNLCESIVAGAPLTIKASKAALDHLARRPGAPTPKQVMTMMRACFDSDDYAEGRTAFMEKRQPVFKGR